MKDEQKIKLVNFDKNNVKHLLFYKKLRDDDTIKERFQGLLPNLLRNSEGIFNKGFLLSLNNELIGYIDISLFNELEKAVYLRAAIDKDCRSKSLGKKMLKDITDYLFVNYTYIKYIKLKIDSDNLASITVANANGYKNIGNDIYVLENDRYMQNKRI